MIPAAPTVAPTAPLPIAPFQTTERPATHFPTIANVQLTPPAAAIQYAAPQQIRPITPVFSTSSGGPSNAKDAMELAAFAISALKVRWIVMRSPLHNTR